MGRGLSELQKTMLTMQPDKSGEIMVRDVMTKYYGWTQHEPYHHFSKKEIGPKRYMAGYIATKKALGRLKSRGLIWSPDSSNHVNNFSHYSLTSEGREILAKLSGSDGLEAMSEAEFKEQCKDLKARLEASNKEIDETFGDSEQLCFLPRLKQKTV